MQTRIHSGVAPALLGAALIAAMPAAQAQIDEIMVTAQRREEAVQDVPLAVSAFSADQISNLQIDVIKDIGQNVPNLQTYTVTAGAQAIQVHSRGASVQNPGFNLSESPVGIYQDDVYFGRLASANLDLTDIERIEVLRGPQGTLYGRNTIAGAIKIVTRTPGDDTWANASIGVGNYETTRLTGSVGGPIEPGALAGSIALLADNRNEGWQNNPVTGASPGEYDNKAARGKLHWYGTRDFDAVLTAWAVHGTNDGYNGVPYVPFANTTPNGSFDPAPPGSAPRGDFYDNFDPAGVNYGKTTQAGADLTLSFDFGGVTLRSITGFADISDKFGFDLAGGGFPFDLGPPVGIIFVPGLVIASDSDMTQVSQEFQLLGTAFNDRLNWLFGLFYLNEDGNQSFAGTIAAPPPAFAEQIGNETNSYAAFAEGTWKFTDALSLTAGLRWTKDKKSYTDVCTGFFCADGVSAPGSASADLSDSWDEVTGKLGIDYELDENQLAYLTFSQGFQAGGFRTLCFGNLTAECGGTPFDPQKVDSVELGYKSDLFDKRVRLNVAIFDAMYKDIQQIVINSTGAGFPIDNIGDVDVYGVEIEITWQPVDNLTVFANAGFQESNFGSVSPSSPPGGLEPPVGADPDVICPNRPDPASRQCATPTDELPSNPQWQGKIGFNYTVGLANDLEFFYGADVFHTDDYYSESRNQVKIDGYTRVNGFLGIGDADKKWQIALSGKNITDERDNVSGIFAQGFTNIRTPLPPVEYMLNFRISY